TCAAPAAGSSRARRRRSTSSPWCCAACCASPTGRGCSTSAPGRPSSPTGASGSSIPPPSRTGPSTSPSACPRSRRRRCTATGRSAGGRHHLCRSFRAFYVLPRRGRAAVQPHQAVLVQLLVKGHAADAQLGGGALAVVAVLVQGRGDQGDLGLLP